ncbi:MAG: LptF/LptG family permease [Phycisphaerales bacterium]
MNIVYRYIARMYVLNIVLLFVLLCGFVVSVDVALNLSRFSKAAAESVRDAGGDNPGAIRHTLLTVMFVVDIWGPRVLQLFDNLLGVVLITAMGFTAAQMVRHRELVAVLAGGMSLHALVRPFLLVAVVFSALQIADQELMLPKVAHLLARDAGDGGKRDIGAFRVMLTPDETGGLLYAARFIDAEDRLESLAYWERDSTGRVLSTVRADAAVWNGAAWALENGVRETPTSTGAERRHEATLSTSLDPERIKVRFLTSFARGLGWRDVGRILRTGGLDPTTAHRLDRQRWGRVAGVASNILTLLIAVPFFLKRLPGGMMQSTMKAAPIAAAGLAASAMAPIVSMPGLPAWLGAFVPSLLLLPVAIAMLSGIRS